MENNISKPDIMSMTKDELRTYLTQELDLPKFRADQIFDWLNKGVGFEGMTNLPKALRERLSNELFCSLPEIEEKFVSKIDGTVKYLFKLYDGNIIESVVMHYSHGNSICISSEVGCNMGCRFCASTIDGMKRRLLPGEMLGQVAKANFDGADISNIVMMGIGEPLDNYENVIKFLHLVTSEEGLNIGARHISLSTCGLADKIYELAREGFGITLSISLHACDDSTRSDIMPINKKYNIEKLLSACRDYFITTGRRISFEYTLIAGKNDSAEQAHKLADLFYKYFTVDSKLLPIHVNLIPVNEVKERDFKTSSRDAVNKFAEILNKRKINATVRRKLGPDINASCGQLRRSYEQAKNDSCPDMKGSSL